MKIRSELGSNATESFCEIEIDTRNFDTSININGIVAAKKFKSLEEFIGASEYLSQTIYRYWDTSVYPIDVPNTIKNTEDIECSVICTSLVTEYDFDKSIESNILEILQQKTFNICGNIYTFLPFNPGNQYQELIQSGYLGVVCIENNRLLFAPPNIPFTSTLSPSTSATFHRMIQE